eukprot:496469_1
MMRALLIILMVQLQMHILYCINNYNCTNIKPCIIDCIHQTYCNNVNIYCPDHGLCQIAAKIYPQTLTNITVYCGNLGSCHISCDKCFAVNNLTIHANDSLNLYLNIRTYPNMINGGGYNYSNINVYGTNINELEYHLDLEFTASSQMRQNITHQHFIYAPNATNIIFSAKGYQANNIMIIADYVNNIDINCNAVDYSDYIVFIPIIACNNISIEAPFAGIVNVECNSDGSIWTSGCSNFNLNAFNVDELNINNQYNEHTMNMTFINATNSNDTNIKCFTQNGHTNSNGPGISCGNITLLCGKNNCNVSGSFYNLTLYATETLGLELVKSSLINSTIYANYSKYVNISGNYSYSEIYAMNALEFNYYTLHSGSNRIYISNALNVSYTVGLDYSSIIFAEYADRVDLKYNLSHYITIHAEYVNLLLLTCNLNPWEIKGSVWQYSPCNAMDIYATNVKNASIKAYNSGAFFLSNIYGSNIRFFDIECVANLPIIDPLNQAGVCSGNFYLSHANESNFKCLGSVSCGIDSSFHGKTMIDVSHSNKVYLYAIGAKAMYGCYQDIAPPSTCFILNGTYASNMTVVFDGAVNEPYFISIYASSNKTTSIYCNGINSCSTLYLITPQGLRDINLVITPKCDKCGQITNDTYTEQYALNYLCIDWFYGFSILCNDGKNNHEMNFAPPITYTDGSGPFPLCDSDCCKGTEFYVSKDSCK